MDILRYSRSTIGAVVAAFMMTAGAFAADRTNVAVAAAQEPTAADRSDTLKRIRDTATLTIGVREASVPFSFIDSKKQPQGYSVDLCLKVADAIKSELKLNTRDRQKEVAFAYTTFVAGIKMLARKSSNIGSVDDLRGKTVVVTKGTTSEHMVRQMNDERALNLTILEARDHDESFAAVSDGRAVAFPMDDVLLYGLISKAAKPDDFAVVGKYLSVEPYAIMLRKDDPAFERLVDRTLIEMFQNGEVRRAYTRWFATKELTVPMNQYVKEAFNVPNTYPAWP